MFLPSSSSLPSFIPISIDPIPNTEYQISNIACNTLYKLPSFYFSLTVILPQLFLALSLSLLHSLTTVDLNWIGF